MGGSSFTAEDAQRSDSQADFRRAEIQQQNSDAVWEQHLTRMSGLPRPAMSDTSAPSTIGDRYDSVYGPGTIDTAAPGARAATSLPSGSGQRELDRINEVLRETRHMGPSRASMYIDLAETQFRDFDQADQRAVLAAMDGYSNALQQTNSLVAVGREPRIADIAVRTAADFAYESEAIAENDRFSPRRRVKARKPPWH